MVKLEISLIALVILVDATLSASTSSDDKKDSMHVFQKKAKKGKDSRSTSSSSGARSGDSSGAGNSLSLTMSSSSSESKKKDRSYIPKSSGERTGWRKWHRKCPRCYEDERKKWKDPTIKWICGAYQRARRSFKSLCSMHYRNCQDGTMFIKVSNYRCTNSSGKEEFPLGDHFFYDYKVKMSDESDDSGSTTTSEESSSSSYSY